MKSPLARSPAARIISTVLRTSSRVTPALCRRSISGSPDSMPSETIRQPAALSIARSSRSVWPTRTAQLNCIPSGFRVSMRAEFGDPRPVGGKEIVVDVEVADPEAHPEMPHVVVDIGRGVPAVPPLEYGAVAVGTLVGAAPAGDHRGAGKPDVAEQRQIVSPRKPGQLFVGGKRQRRRDRAAAPAGR